MESNFNNRDFEQFVKQNADQYRMFPSEKVWNGIHNTLHTRRRWYGIGFTLLLITTAAVSWVMLLSPSDKKQELNSASDNNTTKQTIPLTNNIAPAKSSLSKDGVSDLSVSISNNLFIAKVNTSLNNDDKTEASPLINKKEFKPFVAVVNQPETILTPTAVYHKEVAYNQPVSTPVVKPVSPAHADNLLELESSVFLKDESGTLADYKLSQEKKDIYSPNIENAVNSYTLVSKKNKLIWQIYFLPTISYRKLNENKDFLIATQQVTATSPVNSAVNSNINNVVTHKPDFGLELGFNAGLPLSRRIKLTAGLQMNISKYDIKAYPYVREEARIALSNNNGSTSVSNIQTNYRNFETYTEADWLSNFYISASLPIGLEASLTDTRKTYLGIGGTIQPTYILGDRAYLLSTDFKNYAKVPSLTRDWNLSSSFEIFAGYSTGKLNWKVGPQVRYQMLSSFQKKYPVKEHLIDFGLKVGVMFK